MPVSTLILLMSVAAGGQPDTRGVQLSRCSPNTSAAIGNLTVNCIGVDPRALSRLNAELNPRDMQLAQKVREANEWAKWYKDLEAWLAHGTNENALAGQAEECLHQGDLEKAGTILDQILSTGEKQGDPRGGQPLQPCTGIRTPVPFCRSLAAPSRGISGPSEGRGLRV